MRMWIAAVALGLAPCTAVSQSLAEAARKESERRERLRRAGSQSPLVTERDLAATGGTLANDPGAPAEPEEDEQEPAGEAPATGLPSVGTPAQEAAPETEPEADEDEARRRQEMEWQRWAAAARAQVDRARRRHEYLQRLFVLQQPYEIDENGRRVIMSVSELQRRAGQAEANLKAAEQKLAELMARARRAGIPAGWLR